MLPYILLFTAGLIVGVIFHASITAYYNKAKQKAKVLEAKAAAEINKVAHHNTGGRI